MPPSADPGRMPVWSRSRTGTNLDRSTVTPVTRPSIPCTDGESGVPPPRSLHDFRMICPHRKPHIPVTADRSTFPEAVELGRVVVWLHTFGERMADPSQGRPRGPPRRDEPAGAGPRTGRVEGDEPQGLRRLVRCLYRGRYGEWDPAQPIGQTSIPWAALWLCFYEVWLVTGLWHGRGEHPEVT